MANTSFDSIKAELHPYILSILSDICPGGKAEGRVYRAGATRGGPGKSFFCYLDSGVWQDAATGEKGGDIISLYAHNYSMSQWDSAQRLQEAYLGKPIKEPVQVPTKEIKTRPKLIKPPPNTMPPSNLHKFAGHWIYTDENGNPIYYIVRKNNSDGTKDFYPYCYSENHEWVTSITKEIRVPYNLQELANTEKKILIVEGEKAADAAKKELNGYTVTTWSGGAKAVDQTNWDILKDKDVLLWPDNDKAGLGCMNELAFILVDICKSVKILEVDKSDKPEKWDAYNAFIDENWTSKEFIAWAKPLVKELEKPEVKTDSDLSQKYETYDTGFYFVSFDSKGNETQRPDYDGLANFLKNEIKLKCDDSLRYYFDGKKYSFLNDLSLKSLVNKYLKQNVSAQTVASFANKAQIICYSDLSNVDLESGYLNCNNGILNVKTGELLPHTSEMFFKYVLDHDYNPDAKCPTFLQSIELITKGDVGLQKLIQQVFGYCIEGGHPKAEKFFVFLGSGGNGKSTILTALRNLIGLSNISNVPVSLLDRPFSTISLDGKLVNLCDETPKFSKNAEPLKNIVTGGYIRAAHKGMDEIDIKCNARLIFACNKPPNFGDDSDGMSRRIVAIPFNHKISDADADRNISDKIKAEMSGVLNWALEGLKDLIERDYKFINPQAVIDANEELKRETDSAYDFIKEYIDFLAGENGEQVYEKRGDIYAAYSHHCRLTGVLPISAKGFGSKLNSHIDGLRNSNQLEPMDRSEQLSVANEKPKIIRRVRLNYKIPQIIRTDEVKKDIF